MKRRSIGSLAEQEFDVVVVGGGIVGVCCAWEAASRGLTVALVEQGDFGHATSANCFKIVHGGIRYLQHGDMKRVRESVRERRALLRIAPHLVNPLPIVVPTYGRGLHSKGFMAAGLLLYDLLTLERNRGIEDPDRRIPAGGALSRRECLDLFSGLDPNGLSGGVVFYDGQMYNPPRLALAFLEAASELGAQAVNYARAVGFLRRGNQVFGVKVRDTLADVDFCIRARVVVNAAGPWAEGLLAAAPGWELQPQLMFSRDFALVLNRQMPEPYALAVRGRTADPDALVNWGSRHLFMAPWRRQTLLGVWHRVHTGKAASFSIEVSEVQAYLDEFNSAYSLDRPLSLEDVSLWNAGLVLLGENLPGAVNVSFGKRSRIVDHTREHGVQGLVTAVGVRYTTARGVAEQAIDLAFAKLGQPAPASTSETAPIAGGKIERFDLFLQGAIAGHRDRWEADVVRGLVRNYGSNYGKILRYAEEDASLGERIGGSSTIKAEVVYAVREEMAEKLSDVVLRRTDLGTGRHPGDEALRACAEAMTAELRWSTARVGQEVAELEAYYRGAVPGRQGQASGV